MNIYEKLGIRTIINASDTYTRIGGSRMDKSVMAAMVEASEYFVDIIEFEKKASARIAELTRNKACHICAGAAAGVMLAAAACMTGTDIDKARLLPDSHTMRNEFLILKAQHPHQQTAFLHMIETAGGKLVWIPSDPQSMENAINENTAGVFYYPEIMDFQNGFCLADISKIAHGHDVPVVVDAAAMLPPISNFWYCTNELGADLIIFSGGKHIAGPQTTGLILGKESLVEACRINAGPAVHLGRPAKVGKEEIAGILTAVERFVAMDFVSLKMTYYAYLSKIDAGVTGLPGIETSIQPFGTLHQDYPVLIITLPIAMDGNELHLELLQGTPSIDIRGAFWKNAENTIFINPINLQPDEPELIVKRLRECLSSRLVL